MILWVDDNDELRRAVAEHLAAAGHRVVEAASAEEALEVLERDGESPGLLLTDFRLPGRNGLRLAETLRSRAAALPVLLVTSHATPRDLEGWSRDPAFALLHKPFEMTELEAAASALLAGETRPSRFPDRDEASDESEMRDAAPLVDPSSPPTTQSPPWLRFGLAAVLAAAILGGAWPWLSPGSVPPELPDAPAADDVRRGATIQTLEPFGPVASAPAAFRWRPVANAVHYRLHVEDVAGTSLWQGETDAVELDLPPELADRLLPLAAYYWRVEALDTDRRTTATSDPVRFRIVEPEVQPDPDPEPGPERSSQ